MCPSSGFILVNLLAKTSFGPNYFGESSSRAPSMDTLNLVSILAAQEDILEVPNYPKHFALL